MWLKVPQVRRRLPLKEIGSATLITNDFGAMFPFTVVPACYLPVYASQRPLPDATQDSVRDCSLGFVAAAISDGSVERSLNSGHVCEQETSSHRSRMTGLQR